MDNIKFCCLDNKTKKTSMKTKKTSMKTNKTKKINCAKININIKLNKKLAIFTLIFGGDSYIPGALLLGSSIRKSNSHNANMIILGIMITKDISEEGRNLLKNVYDVIKEVDYIEVSPDLISHRYENVRKIYAKTLTKLRCLEFTEYNKIIFMDADTLVLNRDIFSLFNLKTPACVFMGGDIYNRYFRNLESFKKFQNSYCKNLHGNFIPYNSKINEKTTHGMNIETSIMVLSPNKNLVNKTKEYIKYIENNNIKIKTDTELVSMMFKDKIYAIEPRFFGRWINPEKHPELVIMDFYGYDGKPWDISKIDNLVSFEDVKYWWKIYCNIYNKEYKKYKNNGLDELYKKIKSLKL